MNGTATCVFDYMKNHCQDEQATIFYSDKGTEQNKNKKVASTYLYATEKLNISQITQKFLIGGQIQNDGNSMHATTEQWKEENFEQWPILHFNSMDTVLQMARKGGKPGTIKELSTGEILDFKQNSKKRK